jgi:hypothetical protein
VTALISALRAIFVPKGRGRFPGPLSQISTMLTQNKTRPEYDLPTAVTFLFAGLALGWILTLLFSPLPEDSARRRSGSKPMPIADEVLFE